MPSSYPRSPGRRFNRRRHSQSAPAATGWLHLPARDAADQSVKPAPYLPIYERLLAPLRDLPITLLELGIWNGDSLEMWRDCLPQATVIGVDLEPPEIDLGPRVHLVRGDQGDAALMRDLRERLAPGGFDVVVDDASHFGVSTARSLQALLTDHLKPGGIYVVEDWGTGYLPTWPDGAAPTAPIATPTLDASPDPFTPGADSAVRMPSHDTGMVGLVKRLVDHVAAGGTLRTLTPDRINRPLPIASMTVHDGIVVLRRAG